MMCLTTIESIAKKKDLSEEGSRVGYMYIRNGRQYKYGNSIYIEDIV